jgi:hypothetical protein
MSVTFYFNHDVHTFLSARFRSSVAIFFVLKKEVDVHTYDKVK